MSTANTPNDVSSDSAEARLLLWDSALDQEDVLPLLISDHASREYIFANAANFSFRRHVSIDSVFAFFQQFPAAEGTPYVDDDRGLTTFPFYSVRHINLFPNTVNFSPDLVQAYQEWESYELAVMTKHAMPLSQTNRVLRLLSQLPLLESLQLPVDAHHSRTFDGMNAMPQLHTLVLDRCYIPTIFADIFPQLQKLHVGRLYGESRDKKGPSDAVLPASLTEWRVLRLSASTNEFFQTHTHDFKQIMALLRNSANLRTLTIAELDAIPTDTSYARVIPDDRTELLQNPRIQNDFKVIDAFAALPCWQLLTFASLPLFPWHRLVQYHHHRVTVRDDPSINFIPLGLRVLVSPYHIREYAILVLTRRNDRMRFITREDEVEYATYYCPHYYLLDTCRVYNVMVISNIKYTQWSTRIGVAIKRVLLALRKGREHVHDMDVVSPVTNDHHVMWKKLTHHAVAQTDKLIDMLQRIHDASYEPRDYNLYLDVVWDFFFQLDDVERELVPIVSDWREFLMDALSAKENDVLEFVEALLWLVPILSQVYTLHASILQIGEDASAIMNRIRELQAAHDASHVAHAKFVESVYMQGTRILGGNVTQHLVEYTNERKAFIYYFDLARSTLGSETLLFDSSIIMPTLPLFDTWRSLALPASE